MIERLEKRVRALEERLSLCSQNSSIPPSQDPLGAPKRERKKPTGLKRGAQPGHRGTRRDLLPITEVDKIVEHVPTCCEHCRSKLYSMPTPADLPPSRHQVTELLEKPYEVTEHQAQARTCSSCGKITRAEIPFEHRSAFGPRLVAFIASMTGVVKASRRDTQEFLGDALGIRISLGSVSGLESEVSDSLEEAYSQAAEAVRNAPHKNVDETGWKQAGKRLWLWTAAIPAIAFFVIHQSRGKAGLAELLGKIQGMITSDRWHVYASVKTRMRQICWAHLKRDFKRLAERGGEAENIGKAALDITSQVFLLWRDFRGSDIDRPTLQSALKGIKAEFRSLLQRGVKLELPKVSKFCTNLLALEPALWNFAMYEGIDPTNNHAERVIRTAVIWRKRSFGCDSERGRRFVERMLTAGQSCRLQHRRVHSFLVESIRAHREGGLPPTILPQHA